MAKLHIFLIARAQNGLISTSWQKSDVTVVFPDPDFLIDAGILAIREHLRQILRFMDFHDLGVIFRGKTWELVG